MTLTVPALERVDGARVESVRADDEGALDRGLIHVEGTGYPWEPEANVYIAGHRLGYVGTGSFLVFYDLNELREGDEVRLEDADGREYRYRVYEMYTVEPEDVSPMYPVRGKNVVTLQTCTLPDYERRLIVRAERV
jgi:sortase A